MTLPADLAPFAVHGGRVGAARAAFGDAGGGADWIDLSTGIAPWSYPAPADLGLDRLPEPGEIAALEAAAADAFGVADAARVVAVPGTDLALRLLARLLPAARSAVVTPGYGGHLAAWPGAARVAHLRHAQGHDLIVFACPSNPTGAVVAAEEVRALAERMIVVADEAYADPLPGLAPHASDRLVVLRSFGKFYGLPGLRLGFVIAGPHVVAVDAARCWATGRFRPPPRSSGPLPIATASGARRRRCGSRTWPRRSTGCSAIAWSAARRCSG
ncbi:aminotransferase class I/II-fold pyridoxal phosphate-dependent enzyme [Sphingomonas sp. MMS24-JH45]